MIKKVVISCNTMDWIKYGICKKEKKNFANKKKKTRKKREGLWKRECLVGLTYQLHWE